jgi:hypothetical protein
MAYLAARLSEGVSGFYCHLETRVLKLWLHVTMEQLIFILIASILFAAGLIC